MRTTTAILAAAALAAGCRAPAGKRDDHAWSVRLPRTLFCRGERLAFTVETRGADGAARRGVGYAWSVDWPGLPGAMHRGVSFAEESIRVKGLPGTGFLRIYAEDAAGRRVQVLRQEFRTE
jgi:hypothetical protein